MAKKYFTDESLQTLVDEMKAYADSSVSGKADKSTSLSGYGITNAYTKTEVDNKLSGKADSSHGNHVPTTQTANNATFLRNDNTWATVTPANIGAASQTSLNTHIGNTTVHITADERTAWNAAKTHASSAHAPSNAQPNQNAFSNITVGSTTVSADTVTDTVTFEGSNVTITPDATNDKITFSVANGSTSAKGLVQLTNSTSSTSTTTAATPSSVKSAYDLANTAKTNAATAQSKADSAYSLAEGKVDSLSDLGVTATATELNYVDGVTSAIQTQLDTLTSNKVSKTGDTMTGDLTIKANFGSVRFNDVDGNKMSVLQANNDSHTTSIYAYPTDKSTYYERYDFPTPDTGRTSNKSYQILTTKDVTVTAAELNRVDGVTSNIQTQLDNRLPLSGGTIRGSIDTDDAYMYDLGSETNPFGFIYSGTFKGKLTGNADTSTTATKLATSNGSETQPVYFSDGKPVACTYTLEKSVPSDAKFTDNNTTYTFATGDSNGQIKITPSGGSAQNVAVKGLGSAAYTDSAAYAPASHNQSASTITSGTLSADRLPTVPIKKGGTGATTADAARENIGAMGGKLLWTNSNTNKNFSPQTISLSAMGLTTLTDYAYLIVQFVVSAGASTHQCSAPIFRSTGKYSTQYQNSNGEELRRLVSATVSGGVTLDAGKRNETTDNSVMIPEKIYGFKL